MPHVTTETATVYRVAGERRFMTEKAAYHRAARKLVKAKYWSDDMDGYHEEDSCSGIDMEHKELSVLLSRLARFLRFVDERRGNA